MKCRLLNCILTLILYGSLTSCTRDPIHQNAESLRNAVCVSHNFLKINGYLNQVGLLSHKDFKFEIWDLLTYSKNGKLDTDKLLGSRKGTYLNRYYGIEKLEGHYLVFYRLDNRYSCINVSYDLSNIQIIEADCNKGIGEIRLRKFNPDTECIGDKNSRSNISVQP